MHKKKKTYLFSCFVLGLILLVSGCGKQSSESAAADHTNDPDATEITVGIGNGYKPFAYLNENNELEGYDLHVLKAVDEKLSQYKFNYEAMEFKNILTSIEAKKIRIGAHEFEKNAEREKKYLYGQEGYNSFDLYIASANGHYQTLDDLAGKKVLTSPGGNAAYVLEQYNQSHQHALKLVYGDYTPEVVVKSLQNGTADATLITKFDVANFNKQFKVDLKLATKPTNLSKVYFLFQQGDEALQTAVDGALKQLKETGELDKISQKELGCNFYE